MVSYGQLLVGNGRIKGMSGSFGPEFSSRAICSECRGDTKRGDSGECPGCPTADHDTYFHAQCSDVCFYCGSRRATALTSELTTSTEWLEKFRAVSEFCGFDLWAGPRGAVPSQCLKFLPSQAELVDSLDPLQRGQNIEVRSE